MTQPCKLHTKVFISESSQEESYEITESLSRVIRKHTDIYIKKKLYAGGFKCPAQRNSFPHSPSTVKKLSGEGIPFLFHEV